MVVVVSVMVVLVWLVVCVSGGVAVCVWCDVDVMAISKILVCGGGIRFGAFDGWFDVEMLWWCVWYVVFIWVVVCVMWRC
jgi:hypothetical protein